MFRGRGVKDPSMEMTLEAWIQRALLFSWPAREGTKKHLRHRFPPKKQGGHFRTIAAFVKLMAQSYSIYSPQLVSEYGLKDLPRSGSQSRNNRAQRGEFLMLQGYMICRTVQLGINLLMCFKDYPTPHITSHLYKVCLAPGGVSHCFF
jgi:hypothetical protein